MRRNPIALTRLLCGVALVGTLVSACAATGRLPETGRLPDRQDPRLQPVAQSGRVWNAVTTTPDGRIFVGFPGADRPGIQLAELNRAGRIQAFPDLAWNGWQQGQPTDPHAFVRVNAIRIGPDGALWVMDAGAPGIGKPALPGAARLFRFDLARNRLDKVFDLSGAGKPLSYMDDIRFNGNFVYITDAGAPGLIVLNRIDGVTRRVLDNDPAMTDSRSLYADGKVLKREDGHELRVHADQLEVSPDGRYLYVQPASGPLARIATQYLNDPAVTPGDLAAHVDRQWADTPTSGGTAIDANGTLYLSDTDRRRILTIDPNGKMGVLIADPRLIWSDAMWIDAQHDLWIPATQQNLTPGFQAGKQTVQYPVWIYRMKIDAGPPANDHR